MGIDVSDINQIIHWGMPSSLEEYVQESGRSGRDGSQALAIVYKGNRAKNASACVKEYEANSTICRRKLLFCGFFLFSENDIKTVGCLCCDVCAKLCNCHVCQNCST